MDKTSASDSSDLCTPLAPFSVITTCYGRNRHLYNLLTSLEAGTVKPAEVVIVNDDADKARLAEFDLTIVQIDTASQLVEEADLTKSSTTTIMGTTGFDIGRNRNKGAAVAQYEQLLLLDVDCIVAPHFIDGMHSKLQAHPNALLMGQPYYLTRPLDEAESKKLASLQTDSSQTGQSWLQDLAVLNPYRHNLNDDTPLMLTQDYGAFWSLCFAIHKRQFGAIGGFDTNYVGYGAEDTDFAFMARALDIDFYLTNDKVYHQQHSVSRPPLNHLSSIVINANRFYDKWQHWPMSGWLEDFAKMGLIDWELTQTNPIIIIRVPTEAEISAAHCPDAAFV